MSDERDTLFDRPGAGDRRFVFDRRVVSVFDDMAGRSIPGYHEVHAIAVDLLADALPLGATVLDLGASTGTFLRRLFERRDDLRAVAVDRSAAMIDEARARLADRADAIDWRVEDAATWDPVPVDAVISLWTLQFVAPAARAALVARLVAAVRPGGWVVIAEKLEIPSPTLAPMVERVYHDHKRRNGYSDREIEEKKRALEGVLCPWSEERWSAVFDEVGLSERVMVVRWGPFVAWVGRTKAVSVGADVAEGPDRVRALFDVEAVLGGSVCGLDRIGAALDTASYEVLRTRVVPTGITVDSAGRVRAGRVVAPQDRTQVEGVLRALAPWRKGPFAMADVAIDAEWDASRKWERIAPLLAHLPKGCWADVGGGNGYYAWRLVEAGLRVVVFEPWERARAQLEAFACVCTPDAWGGRLAVSSLGVESMGAFRGRFDALLLMGILYHRTDPFETLRIASSALRSGGRMLVETIVVPGEEAVVHIPAATYAGARGFWGVPTEAALEAMFRRCDLRVVARTEAVATSPSEQRASAWSGDRSLQEGLDPKDVRRTVEGLPAPWRVAYVVARGSGG